MEIIRRKTDYALRCLAIMAELGPRQRVSVRQLAEQEEIPEDLLHKVMQTLGRAKLVRATRGRTGGFRLAKPSDKITVLRVLEALQGPFAINRCFLSTDRCIRKENCWLRDKLVQHQEELIGFFGSVTIANLIDHGGTLRTRT